MKTIATGLLVFALALPALAQCSQDKGAERGGKWRLSQMDKDHVGRISRDEWKGRGDRFDRLDSNHDEFITRDELKQNRKNVRSNFRAMDKNIDGRISRQEWQGSAVMFDRLDTDNDGFITKDEIRNRARFSRQR